MKEFTPTEAAALVGLTAKRVRNELEKGILPTPSGSPKLAFEHLVYLRALVDLEELEPPVVFRSKLAQAITLHLSTAATEPLVLSHFLSFNVGEIVLAVRQRVEAFENWRAKLVEDPEILGGEPVFPGSRLSVRHIGALVSRGAQDELREDYPELTDEDLHFAQIFEHAYPKRGRPVAQASAR